jgi:hypothetical protein
MLCSQVNIRGLLVTGFLSLSVRAHLWYSCNLNTRWNGHLKQFLFSSWGCSLLRVWLLHGATFVIITKFNPSQKDFSVLALLLLLLLLLLSDSPGVSEKFTSSTLVNG